MQQKQSGFTLVETLISLGILGVMTITLLNLQKDVTQISTSVSAQASLAEDLRIAGAIIADEAQRAVYIFPPCGTYRYNQPAKNLTEACDSDATKTTVPAWATDTSWMNVYFSRFVLSTSGDFMVRPDKVATATDARTWEVGKATAPILAMIVAPREPTTKACVLATKEAGCYYFVAYYPVKRSAVSRKSATDLSTDRLNADENNKDNWVLMEYREALTVESSAIIQLEVTGLGKVNVPATEWKEVGCNNDGFSCPDEPIPDPRGSIQDSAFSIPAISRAEQEPAILAKFGARMSQTVRGIGGSQANILVDGILPTTGFQIEYPTIAVDERGVTEVRLKLQMGINTSGGLRRIPASPIEIYITPRNLPAQ